MATQLSVTQSFSASPEAVLDLLRDRDFVTACVQSVNGPQAVVLVHRVEDAELTVISESPVPAAILPGPLRNMLPSNAHGTKSETWTKTGDGYRAVIEIAVTGAPASVIAEATLTVTETGATLSIAGKAEVKIPFIGPKIEKMMVDQASERLTAEGEFINTRLGTGTISA
ncbi:DUF2505 domain-containing protein [Nocardia sp. CA2R105]|uniref:DUF2505 domain-containing protein n=1 Tax=Nocardia coffeae TaxID=2873381 RepID=UPI001CA70340|nr:DUF2505 domain-containing protein [Nocardia coffeae]MBY8863413.1 DUF2505 domain-containing protein [Nocardia coffeae]